MNRIPDLSRAATLACRVLLARRTDSLPVDPLAMLRACRDTAVYTLEAAVDVLDLPQTTLAELLRDADAATYRIQTADGTRFVVVYRTDGNPARLRFTLAHELGHRMMKHTGGDPAEEREADCFASYLLCPEPVVRFLAKAPGDVTERIATTCYVSRSCARAALRRMPSLIAPEILAEVEALLSHELETIRQV